MPPPQISPVFITATTESAVGVHTLIDQFDLSLSRDGRVALKANYNSDDPFPASTHIDTLRAILGELRAYGDGEITLAERSGMGITASVLKNRGVSEALQEHRARLHVLDRAKEDEWVRVNREGFHWRRGFLIAREFTDSDRVIETCCLKTHRFGGHFTMSLKNSVGMVAMYDPQDSYDYMRELHTSPYQRLMIAEINAAYPMHMAIMDAREGFSRGGPEAGERILPGLFLASQDRIALDAVGVALLRMYGTTPEVTRGRIFEQEQIMRAAELGVGVPNASSIQLVPLDPAAEERTDEIQKVLDEQG